MAQTVQIRCVTDCHGFEILELAWNALLADSDQANPFLTHQWLWCWWQAFGEGAELHLLLFYRQDGSDERLVGIFPGFIRTEGWLVKVRTLRFLGSEIVTSDFLDLIVAPGHEKAVYNAFCEYIQTVLPCQLVELTDLPESSGLWGALGSGGIGTWFLTQWPVEKRCPYLALPADAASYFAGLSANTRKRYRYRRKLEAKGMTLEHIREMRELPEALSDFRRMHTARRQQKGDAGIFATPEQSAFYQAVMAKFLAAGWLDLVFLCVEGQRVAVLCQFDYGGSIYYYQAGYDPAWEQSRVGFVLLCLLLEEAIGSRKQFYEFLRGGEEYKYRFGITGERKLVDYSLRSGSMTAAIAVHGRKLNMTLRKSVKAMLPVPLRNALIDQFGSRSQSIGIQKP